MAAGNIDKNCAEKSAGEIFSNANSLWGYLAAGCLEALGVRQAVISPGSRSTPLTYALSRRAGIECLPVLDERGAAFLALGLARQSGNPVVLVCTSGSAGAHYFPAVIEAHESGIPLLLLTADRPPEMRHNHSGQTIDQQKLFGEKVRHFAELPVPEMREEILCHLRQALAEALCRARFPLPGPVHLNCPFRDPLAPEAVPDKAHEFLARLLEHFFTPLQPYSPPEIRDKSMPQRLPKKGLIVAGSWPVAMRQGLQDVEAVLRLARKTGWPIIADALGPWRFGLKPDDPVINAYDAILRNAEAAARLRPDAVIQIGSLPTSKILRGWLGAHPVPTWIVDPTGGFQDSLHRGGLHLRGSLASVVENLRPLQLEKASKFNKRWMAANKAARQVIDQEMRQCGFAFEGKVSWLVDRFLPDGCPVFLANSMSVRDAEFFWAGGKKRRPVYFNRGANGIDGNLSTAMGIAHGNPFAVMLTGDLALLHDLTAFLGKPRLRGHLTIVLLNNHGGGIFENLPIASLDPPFEEFFATPQEVDFGVLAEAFGLDYMKLDNIEELAKLIPVMPPDGIRLVEVKCDRKKDAVFRRSILNAAAKAVSVK